MKKLLLAAVPLALLAAHLVRVQLVAAAADKDTANAATTSADATQARAQNGRTLPAPVTNPDSEGRTFRKLANPTNVEFIDLGLADAVQYFSDFHGVPIRIDEEALQAAKIPVDSPVTLKMDGVPFRRILNRVLVPLDLDWYVDGPGLLVTTRSATGSRLDDFLKYEIQIIEYLCELTDAQSRKLQLAGRGDIQRLLDGIQERTAKIQLVRNDEKKVAELLLEIEQFQQRVETGLFGKDSLFRKMLETLLTPAQMVRYKPIQEVFQAGGMAATIQRGPDAFLSIRLSQTALTDDGLARLKQLPLLGSLDVNVTKVTDAGLVHVKDLTNLRELGLYGTQITDPGLAHLKGLTHLQGLNLGGTRVTDVGLTHLKGLTNLQSLFLVGTETTDVGLAHLKGLTSLESLNLSFDKITDAGLIHLKILTNLQRLELYNTPVTDAGLVHLRALTNLQRLDLGGTQVTDAGLDRIKGMTSLRSLNLHGSKVTDDGIADLMRTLPKLTIGN